MSPYESLASAIVVQAVRDYRRALRFLERHPHTPDLETEEAREVRQKRRLLDKIVRNESMRNEAEEFFRSGWFETLSNLDGEVLLRKVRAMEVG